MKKLIIVLIIAVSFMLGACVSASASAEQEGSLKIYRQSEVAQYKTLNVVDHETGVNYVVFVCSEVGVAICPRYNADGTLYLSLVG